DAVGPAGTGLGSVPQDLGVEDLLVEIVQAGGVVREQADVVQSLQQHGAPSSHDRGRSAVARGVVQARASTRARRQRKSRLAGTAVPTRSASTRSASKLTAP